MAPRPQISQLLQQVRQKAAGLMAGKTTVGALLEEGGVRAVALRRSLLLTKSKESRQFPAAGGAVGEALQTAGRHWGQPMTVIGVPTESTFFMTVEVSKNEKSGQAVADLFLRNAKGIDDGLVSTTCDFTIGERRFFNIGACRNGLVAKIMEAGQNFKPGTLRIEPVAWALIRSSFRECPAAKEKSGLEIRVFQNTDHYLVAAVYGERPLAWSCAERGADAAADLPELASQVQRLVAHLRRDLGLGETQALVFFGDRLNAAEVDQLGQGAGLACHRVERPDLDADRVCTCLAESGQSVPEESLNLVHSQQPITSWTSLLPHSKVLVLGVITGLLALALTQHIYSLNSRLALLKTKNREWKWAATTADPALASKRKKLIELSNKLDGFLGSKLDWSPFLRHVISLLPENTWLTNIEGFNQIFEKSMTVELGQRYLIVRGAALFPNGVTTPQEIDKTLQAFKGSPWLQKEFSNVTLDAVTWKKEGRADIAFFSIRCVPKQVRTDKGSDW